jgi:glycosyltransferase involved in cell wall biosynthesis
VIDIAVLGHDPSFGDGSYAQTEAFMAGTRALGREPELLYARHPALAGRRLSLDRVEAIRQARAARRFAPAAAAARSLWVVATTAAAGAAAHRSGREYRCWIGTSLDDEWVGRSADLGRVHRAAFELSMPTLRRSERGVLRGAERLYATSRGSRAAVAAAAGLPVDRVAVLPIPVDTVAFAPEPDDVWTGRLERPVLAFVGRGWDPRKNVGLLLRALPILRQRIPQATLLLIGEPPSGPLPDGARSLGRVASVAEHLRTASLFVLPSRQEGFGIVAAEALASGVPVLSTRSGGPEELIERSGGGRLLDTFDPEELAEAAAELLGDVATLTAMRSRGREYVEREHAPAVFQARLAEALR